MSRNTSDPSGRILLVVVAGVVLGCVAGCATTPSLPPPPNDVADVFGPLCAAGNDPVTNTPAAVYGPGTRLHRKTIDLADFPAARCNDGTAGAYYVHRANEVADEDKWVIYLEGGFSCKDFEECRARWCNEESPQVPDVNAQKMSSRWLDETIGGYGILHSLVPANNTFANWNHVLVHYCSSDRWSARSGRVTLDDGTDQATITFRGRNVLRAALRELLDSAGVTADDGHAMPSLGGASIVIWSGTSAGGRGAVQSANAARDEIALSSPNVDFRVIVDGAYAAADPAWVSDLEDHAEAEFPNLQTIWDVQYDAACEADHPGEEWRCTNKEVLNNYVTFPFFVRQDLADTVAVNFLSALVGATEADIIAATEAELVTLNTVANASYYGSCSSDGHVWLTLTDKYRDDALADPSPAGATTMNDAMAEWLATGGPVQWYDVPDAATGLCP